MLIYSCVQLHWQHLLVARESLNGLFNCNQAASTATSTSTTLGQLQWTKAIGILLPLHSLFLSLMISIVGWTQHAHSTEIKSFPLSTVAAKELWCNSWQQLKSNRNESYSIAEEIDLFASGHRNNTNGCCSFNTQLSIYECALTYWRHCVRVHVTGKQNWALDTFLSAPYDFHGNCSRK